MIKQMVAGNVESDYGKFLSCYRQTRRYLKSREGSDVPTWLPLEHQEFGYLRKIPEDKLTAEERGKLSALAVECLERNDACGPLGLTFESYKYIGLLNDLKGSGFLKSRYVGKLIDAFFQKIPEERDRLTKSGKINDIRFSAPFVSHEKFLETTYSDISKWLKGVPKENIPQQIN